MTAQASTTAPAPTGAPAVGPGDQVFLIDGTAFIFRAYFQSMNQDSKYNTRPSDGLPTGAVRLFSTKLLQLIREGAAGVKPTHLAVVFDKSASNHRKELFPDYKGHRPDAPDELKRQMPLVREAVRAFGLDPVEVDGHEADDLIATYTREAAARGACVLIVSPDKDLMQLVGPRVRFYDPESGDPKKDRSGYRPERNLDVDGVVERWGVPPDKIADALALIGDTSDNIPGVPGVGPKAATALITELGSIENVLAYRDRPEELDAVLSRRLAELQADIDALAGGPLKVGSGGQIAQVLAERFGVRDIPHDKKGAPCADSDFLERLAAKADDAEPEAKPGARQLAQTVLRARALSRVAGATARKVLDNADQALLSKQLATLNEQAPLPVPLDDLTLVEPEPGPLIAFFKAMELSTLARRIAQLAEMDPQSVEPDARLRAGSRTAAAPQGAPAAGVPDEAPTPARLVAARAAEATHPFDTAAYETVTDVDRLREWAARAVENGVVALALLASSADPIRADLVGLSLALAPGEACYVPLGHRGADLFDGGGPLAGQVPVREALEALRPALESAAVLTVGHDQKFGHVLLARHGVALAGLDDIMLVSYVLDAGKGGHALEDLARRHLGYNPVTLADVVGSGRQKVALDQVAPDKAAIFGAQQADIAIRLWRILKPRLPAEHRLTVYETLERPMVAALSEMERRGITVDRNILSRLSGDFSQSLARLEHEIQELAGEPFSLGSPKQIGDILFGKMGLPGAKKTPTGQWTTRATLLDELAELGHDLPAKILEWRQLSKLKSTYTDSLPAYMDPQTSRIHTSFSLAATTTGRLSSTEPNLQNIPIRREEGRKIRTAFVAPPGQKIISADYSQIELRLLAHIAEIPQLRQAFADGIDIHSATASAMFGVPLAEMNPDLRRSAKTINFGIIYGISAFGLAQRLAIPHSEAAGFIKQYFERFPGIRDYMVETKEKCRQDGYVTTLFGRVCHYPQIRSANPQERAAVERQAINAPIQGSAADIIRRAMVRMDDALAAAGLSARMLLQVHDELVFEVPDEEVEATLPVVARVMEEAPRPAVSLRVPLAVDARAGGNWDEAH